MSVLKIHLTYRCTAACDHCRFACRPGPGAVIDPSLALGVAQVLHLHNQLDLAVLMGGEPGLVPHLTHQLTRELTDMGLQVRVETNASWATDEATALRFLEPLYSMGASVMFSLDAFHEPFVPPERVGLALRLSGAMGGAHNIESAYLLGPGSSHPLDRRTEALLTEWGTDCRVYRGNVYFVGRAAHRLAPLVAECRGVPTEACTAVPWWSQGEQETTDLLILDPQGYLSKGCGIALGNVHGRSVESIEKGHDVRVHPILGRLVTDGPLALAREAEARGLYRLRTDYADRCHLCQEAREALQACYPDLLTPDQHYQSSAR
jgi:hypothetical protein